MQQNINYIRKLMEGKMNKSSNGNKSGGNYQIESVTTKKAEY